MGIYKTTDGHSSVKVKIDKEKKKLSYTGRDNTDMPNITQDQRLDPGWNKRTLWENSLAQNKVYSWNSIPQKVIS